MCGRPGLWDGVPCGRPAERLLPERLPRRESRASMRHRRNGWDWALSRSSLSRSIGVRAAESRGVAVALRGAVSVVSKPLWEGAVCVRERGGSRKRIGIQWTLLAQISHPDSVPGRLYVHGGLVVWEPMIRSGTKSYDGRMESGSFPLDALGSACGCCGRRFAYPASERCRKGAHIAPVLGRLSGLHQVMGKTSVGSRLFCNFK